jgi:molybdate transport system ATP-binding protein
MTLHAAIARRLSPAFALDIDISVAPGITILFGASGSGKSTILRCLAGLARPDGGRIAVGDRVLFDSAHGIDVPPQRRHVGYVFQQLALFPHLTAAQNIGFGIDRLPRHERQQRIGAIAASFAIGHLLDRLPAQLSGGERQRTALARTLVTEPALLLLDEPLSALDHDIQSRIIDDLRRWNEARRIPMLYVTHAHREVYALGERVIVIDDGRVVASGSPHAVLDHPGHLVVAQLSGFENIFAGVVTERHEHAGTMHVRLDEGGTGIEVPLTRTPAGDRINVAVRAGDILVASEPPRGISARNVLHGTIAGVRREGPTIVATVRAGAEFVVHLTPGGFESLERGTGDAVWLIVKTYSCRIASAGTELRSHGAELTQHTEKRGT